MAGILEAAQTTLDEVTNVNVTAAFRDAPLFEYQQVVATDSMSSIPRFGHSTNFSRLFLAEDAAEAREDYIGGLLFVGVFVITFFALWSLVVAGLKCFGPGFLSGRPFTWDLEEDDDSDKRTQFNKWIKRGRRIRYTFLACGVILILFAILLVSQGFQQVEQTRSTADSSLDNVRGLLDEATSLTEDLRDIGVSAIDLRDQLVVELGKDRLCPSNPNYLQQDQITQAIEDNAGAAIDMLEVLGEFATRDIKQMDDGLSTANESIDDIDSYVEFVAEYTWLAILYAVIINVFTALMMVGVVGAIAQKQNNCYQHTLSWAVLPVFVVMILISYVLCGFLALSASANADFCVVAPGQSPDITIMAILQNQGVRETTIEYDIARYYLEQCTAEAKVDPFLFLRRHQLEISNAQEIVQQLSKSIQVIDVDTLSFNCGRDFEPLRSSLDTMMAILDKLESAAASGLDLLRCDRIVPIYADVIYEGTCNHSVTGLTWTFSSLLIISTMGMIMIMFRAAFHNSSVLAGAMDPTDEDSGFYDVNKTAANPHHLRAMQRGQQEADGAAYDLQLQEENRWRSNMRQSTSDSESVYTSDNGELHITEVDPANVGHHSHTPSPLSLSDMEQMSFDSYRKPRPTAPYESQIY